jgi:hypothetical protein
MEYKKMKVKPIDEIREEILRIVRSICWDMDDKNPYSTCHYKTEDEAVNAFFSIEVGGEVEYDCPYDDHMLCAANEGGVGDCYHPEIPSCLDGKLTRPTVRDLIEEGLR